MTHNAWPVAVARCSQRGGTMANAAGAPRLWCSVFSVFSSYGTGGVRGAHQGVVYQRGGGGGSGAGRAATRFKPQPSVMVGECSKGRLMTRLGQTGVAWNVEYQRWVDGAQGASHTAWRYLGFVSVFIKIPAQLPSIYKGFGLIILCACRALSPSSQIQLGFDNSFYFVEILAGGVSVSVMTQRRVGDAGAGSARPAGPNLAHGQIKTGKAF
jgi:hypothetical protein